MSSQTEIEQLRGIAKTRGLTLEHRRKVGLIIVKGPRSEQIFNANDLGGLRTWLFSTQSIMQMSTPRIFEREFYGLSS